jgi:hypothetical protein
MVIVVTSDLGSGIVEHDMAMKRMKNLSVLLKQRLASQTTKWAKEITTHIS